MRLNLNWRGIELLIALSTVLVALKLLGYIALSWWLVLAPIYLLPFIILFASFGVGIGVLGGFVIVLVVDSYLKNRATRARKARSSAFGATIK